MEECRLDDSCIKWPPRKIVACMSHVHKMLLGQICSDSGRRLEEFAGFLDVASQEMM